MTLWKMTDRENRDVWWLLFSFEGRIGRSKYWLGYGIIFLWAILSTLFTYVVMSPFGEGLASIVDSVAGVLSMIASVALASKRLHDRDRSGWWQLILLVPLPLLFIAAFVQSDAFLVAVSVVFGVTMLLFFIETGCLRGTRGPNRFGADPLIRAEAAPAGAFERSR